VRIGDVRATTVVNEESASPGHGNANAEAEAWFVRGEGREMTAGEAAAFAAWRRVPENARQYQSVAALWEEFDSIPPHMRPTLPPTTAATASRPPRRKRAAWGCFAAAMAACAIGFAGLPGFILQWQADIVTRVGEIRTAKLPDGSTITLDTSSAVSIDFNNNHRHVRLLAGAAAFKVVSDPSRPFVVDTQGGSTRALGTEFIVRNDADAATVIGIEHKVEVSYGASPAIVSAVTLSPGNQVRYGAATGLGHVFPAPVNVASWLRGYLIVEDRPLAEVVADLDRYHRGHIRIVGDDVAQLVVNGVFPIADTRASIDALTSSLGLSAVWLTDYLVIISR
jgi:transmembrane sensor